MKLMKYKTRELRTLSLLILVALLAVLSPPSLTDSVAYAQDPATPVLTATSRQASSVELSWTEVSGARYVIARYDRTAGEWAFPSESHNLTTYTDNTVQAGRRYVYRVSADDRNTWSNQQDVYVGFYDAPTLNAPTASTLPGKIDVSWSAVAGVNDYDLHRYEQTEGWRHVGVDLTGTTYADNAVDVGKSYLYQVRASGDLGAGAWSDQQSATVPRTAPSMPQNFMAAAGDAQAMLSWDPPLYTGGSVITGYQYRYQMAGGAWSSWMATSPALSRAATVSGLTNDSDYNFEVRAQNAIGDGAVAMASAMPMSTVPATPMNLRSTSAGPNEIMLEWDMVAGATGYELQRRVNGGEWEMLTGVTGTAHTDSGRTPSTSYDYEVRATNASGSSPWSGAVTVNTSPPQEPEAPTLSASATMFTITLTWTAPNNGGAPITHYDIEASSDGSTWTTLAEDKAADATMHEDASLPGGTVKHYRIRAVNSVGDGAWSAAQMAAVAPAAPTLSAEAGYRQVILTWTQSGDAPVTSYRIEKLNDQSEWDTETTQPASTALRYTDTGLADSTVHTYRIVARNDAGESGPSPSAFATTLGQPVRAPGPPTGLSATSGPGKVTLTWQAPLFTGGAAVSSYEYRYKEDSATGWSGWMSTADKKTVEVMPLKPGTEYDFEVRARNSVGAGEAVNSDALDAADKTPGVTGPTAVPVLRTSLGTHAGTTPAPHESNAEITVSWVELPATANGGVTGAVTTYELCYKKSTDSAWMRWDDTTAAFGAPSATGSDYSAVHGFDANGGLLDPGTTYQYRARGLNSVATAGTAATCTHWDGDWSAVVSATTPAVEPAAPTLHPAAGAEADDTTTPPTPARAAWDLGVNSITIRWTAPATNGGADITSYEVWVSATSSAGLSADDVAALKPTVASLPAVRLEYVSVGLTATEEYFYRVRARNGSGNDRVSVWSAEVSGTTRETQAGTPGAPTSVAGAHATGDVTVTWTAPTDHGTSPITHYEVQYQQGTTGQTEFDWSDATTAMDMPAVTTWVHKDAAGAKMFVYRVRAVNSSGAGPWSAVSALVDVPARAASKPELTATAAGADEILLEWNTPQDNGTPITGYVIQKWDPAATPPGWDETGEIEITDMAATVHSDTSLMAGTTYYYRIRADGTIDGTWSATMMSEAASATTDMGVPEMPVLMVGDGTVPVATDFTDYVVKPPTVAVAAPMSDTITLYWAVEGIGGSAITGYVLQRYDPTANSGAGDWMTVASPAADATSQKDDGLAPGKTYHYRLQASNAIGASPWSADVAGMTVAGSPDAPELMAMATGRTSIRLTWTVPDDMGTPITGYELVIWDSATTDWATTNLLAVDATVTEFVHTGLTAGTKYIYRIRASVATGNTEGTWSATSMDDGVEATTHGDTPGRPAFADPAGSAITANSLTLTWTAPTDTGGSAITGYDVQIWNGSIFVDEGSVGATVLTYTDSGLKAGTTYYYQVRAKNSEGAGPWSAFASVTTTAAAPDAPVLTATTEGMNSIRLTWTVPADNGVTDGITGYRLQRWGSDPDSPNTWPTSGDTLNLLADTDTVTLFVNEGLSPGTMYHFRIRTLATTESDWSATVSATTVAGRPGKPVLTATADGQNAINLSWTAAMANGSPVYRYELQRWDKEASTWEVIRNNLPSTRTTYRHSGLTADTNYVYRIRGVNRAADNGGLGNWSTIKFVRTAK